jgi:hypothetical protein
MQLNTLWINALVNGNKKNTTYCGKGCRNGSNCGVSTIGSSGDRVIEPSGDLLCLLQDLAAIAALREAHWLESGEIKKKL